MILQRSKGVLPVHEKWGCYLFDILFWTVVFNPAVVFTVNRVNDLRKPFINNGWIDDEDTVLRPWLIFDHFGVSVEIRTDFPNGHKAPADYICQPGEFEINRWKAKTGHFVCGDGRGNTTYDPWGSYDGISPFSYSVTHGELVDKRIFRLLKQHKEAA